MSRRIARNSDGDYKPAVESLAKKQKEQTLKRTRRVEVIRYSYRSTVISSEVALEPDLSTKQAAIDLLLEIPGTIETRVKTASTAERQLSDADVPAVVLRRRPEVPQAFDARIKSKRSPGSNLVRRTKSDANRFALVRS